MGPVALRLTNLGLGGLSCEWCMPEHLEVDCHQIVKLQLRLSWLWITYVLHLEDETKWNPSRCLYVHCFVFVLTREGYVKVT